MANKIYLSTVLIIAFLSGFISGCSGAGNSDEVEVLKEQINLLSTQNSLLLEKAERPPESGLVVPPPPSTESPPFVEIATPVPESLPTEPVSAGQPIIFDGWSLTVSKEIVINTHYNDWSPIFYLRNIGDNKRVFRFTNASITAKDDLGNVYEPHNRDFDTCEQYFHEVKNIEIDVDESITIDGEDLGYNNCDETDGIQMITGPIPLDVSQLIIHFEDFGPFTGIDVIIDL